MRVGIIVYSLTGNTLYVCEKLKSSLLRHGHQVTIDQLDIDGANKKEGSRKATLKTIPLLEGYDALVFASPVEAFSLAPIMVNYCDQISFEQTNVTLIITQYFPFKWMGGKRALRQFKNVLNLPKNTPAAIINWSRKKREEVIIDEVECLSEYINQTYLGISDETQ